MSLGMFQLCPLVQLLLSSLLSIGHFFLGSLRHHNTESWQEVTILFTCLAIVPSSFASFPFPVLSEQCLPLFSILCKELPNKNKSSHPLTCFDKGWREKIPQFHSRKNALKFSGGLPTCTKLITSLGWAMQIDVLSACSPVQPIPKIQPWHI